MNFLGIGPLELVFILIFALIIFGPEDLAKAGRTVGRMLNKLVHSSEWRTLQNATREISTLPNKLMREANLEDIAKEIGSIGNPIVSPPTVGISGDKELAPWTTPPDERPQPAAEAPQTANSPDSSETQG